MKYILIAAAVLVVGASAASAQRMDERRREGREGMSTSQCEERRAAVRSFERSAMRDGRMSFYERRRIAELRRQADRACSRGRR